MVHLGIWYEKLAQHKNAIKSQRGSLERRIFFLGAMGGGPGWALRVRPDPDLDPVPDPVLDPQGPGWAHPGPSGHLRALLGTHLGPYCGHMCFWKNKKSTPPLTPT